MAIRNSIDPVIPDVTGLPRGWVGESCHPVESVWRPVTVVRPKLDHPAAVGSQREADDGVFAIKEICEVIMSHSAAEDIGDKFSLVDRHIDPVWRTGRGRGDHSLFNILKFGPECPEVITFLMGNDADGVVLVEEGRVSYRVGGVTLKGGQVYARMGRGLSAGRSVDCQVEDLCGVPWEGVPAIMERRGHVGSGRFG